MDKESVIGLAKRFSEIVRQSMPVKQIVLYGSYVKDEENPDSDIDIAVIVESLDEDFIKAQTKLFKLRRSIDLRIEPILIEQSNNKSGFLEEILESGIEIYSTIA